MPQQQIELETSPTEDPKRLRKGSVSVVCPFFNEEAVVDEAAESMATKLADCFEDWELILVNDGSTDTSLDKILAYQHGSSSGRISVISYDLNRGRGHALRQGIAAARGDIIVTTEVDLSWGEDIVPRLFDALMADESAHLVIGSPQLAETGYKDVPLSRRLVSRYGNKLINLFFKNGLTMHTGMTRAYRREVIAPMEFESDGKEFHLEVLLKLLSLGFRAIEIPATISWETRNRTNGNSARSNQIFNRRMLGTISSHLLFIALARPMAYFGVIAAVAIFAGGIVSLAAIWNLLTGGVSAFFAVIAMLLFLFGVLFMGFAVVFTQLRDLSKANWQKNYDDHSAARTKLTRHDLDRR